MLSSSRILKSSLLVEVVAVTVFVVHEELFLSFFGLRLCCIVWGVDDQRLFSVEESVVGSITPSIQESCATTI